MTTVPSIESHPKSDEVFTELISTPELAQRNTVIGLYNPASFHALLNNPNEIQYGYSFFISPEGATATEAGVLTTSFARPKVLAEDGAGFCSIMLTYDVDGNAVLLHIPLISPFDDEKQLWFSKESDDAIFEYRRRVRKLVKKGGNNTTILTGHTDSTEANADNVLRALGDFLGQAYSSNRKRFTEPRDLKRAV